jgi:ABC-type multidrug transport system ATPase subunit
LNQENNTTLVLVTHDVRLAQRCDRVLTLKDGQLTASEKAYGLTRYAMHTHLPLYRLLAWQQLKANWRAGDLRVLLLALVLAVAAITSVNAFSQRIAGSP